MDSPLSSLEELIARLTAGRIRKIRVSPQLWEAAWHHTEIAVTLFGADEAKVKAYVAEELGRLARRTDIRGLPDWIETPIEELGIHMAAEFAWHSVQKLREWSNRAGR